MTIGEFHLKRQIGGRGAYAKVRLDVIPASPPFRFESSEVDCDRFYVAVVHTAVLYSMERLRLENKNPLHVNVRLLELTTSDVDTSVMQVFYASVHAYCNALGLQFDKPLEFEIEGTSRTLKLDV